MGVRAKEKAKERERVKAKEREKAKEGAKEKVRAKAKANPKEREKARRVRAKANTDDSSTLAEVSSDNQSQRIQLIQRHIKSLIKVVPMPMLLSLTNLDQPKLAARPGRLCM